MLYSLYINLFTINHLYINIISHAMRCITLLCIIACLTKESIVVQKRVFIVIFLLYIVVISQSLVYINNSLLYVLHIYMWYILYICVYIVYTISLLSYIITFQTDITHASTLLFSIFSIISSVSCMRDVFVML